MGIGENYERKITPIRSNISRLSRGTIRKCSCVYCGTTPGPTIEWWAWVDLSHRPHPYQRSVDRFYNNLQERGDCQTTRKPHKTIRIVGWVVVGKEPSSETNG